MTAIRYLRSVVSFLIFVILALTFVFTAGGTVYSATNEWSNIDREVQVQNRQLYAPLSTNSLPEIVFLGQGPGTFTTPLEDFIIKHAPIDFVFEPGPTYTTQTNERIWGVKAANDTPPAIWDGEVTLGPVEAMCTARYVGIDDDHDGRRNAFYLNGEKIEMISEGMVFEGSFLIPEKGEIVLHAEDPAGGWFLPCTYSIANFYASPSEGFPPLTVYFTNLSTGDFDQCQWDFGDESFLDSCEDPAHTYNSSGSFTVTLTVDGPGGSDKMIKSDYITVYEPVEAEFSATPTYGIKPLKVDFTNLSTGDFDQCLWDFGDDSNLDSCDNPAHTYNSPGSFTVSLTVARPGGSDKMIKSDYITVYEAVEAEFSATPTNGIKPLEVDFINLSTGDFDRCLWDFGDGSSSEMCSSRSHIYDSSGIFTVTLTVDGSGGRRTKTKVDYITVHEPVKANFSASPETGPPPLEVNFTNLSAGDFDQCFWDFGDDETMASCGNPKHTYKGEGDYSVTLTVNGLGGDDTMTIEHCVKVAYYRVFLPGVLWALQ